jgi:cysteine desulfurase/selenocysteine lyase
VDPNIIYLNNATTSYPKSASALTAFNAACNRIPADIRHTISTTAAIPALKARVATLIGVEADNVYFPSDATFALNLVIQGVLDNGDTCVTDTYPHNAISRTITNKPGVRWLTVDGSGDLDRIPRDTRLVCLTHVNNVTGDIFDMETLIAGIRAVAPGAAILVDSSQAAGLVPLRPVCALADFVVFPGHKYLHSVPGASVLVAKQRLKPVVFGGTGTNSMKQTDYDDGLVVEVGTPNIPAIEALAAALEDADRHLPIWRSTVTQRLGQLTSGLSSIGFLTLLGERNLSRRTAIAAFSVNGVSAEAVWIPFLAANGIIARGGMHCAPTFHQRRGFDVFGTVRLSVSRFTTEAEIEASLTAVGQFEELLAC